MGLLEDAQAELADCMAPLPEDWVGDLTPVGALLYGFEYAKALLEVLTGAAVSLNAGKDDEAPALTEALNGAAMSLAGLTHALVALEVLPKAAEDALAVPAAPRA